MVLPLVLSILLGTGETLAQSKIDLIASKDNTLYEQAAGGISNGSGEFLFAGRTSSAAELRRGLIQFDLGLAIPAGARIDSAVVTLRMSKSVAGTNSVGLHRMLANWGESTSDAPGEEGSGAPAATGDATWTHSMHTSTAWSTVGGQFESESDASRNVGNTGFYSWRGAALAATVQSWLENPSSNFGWAILGDEQASSRTTKRFDSRENSVAINRPKISIYYSVGVGTEEERAVPTSFANLTAYPNPVSGSLHIRFESSGSETVQMELVDMLGRRVSSLGSHAKIAGLQEYTLPTNGMHPGIYILRVSNPSNQISKIVVVQ